MGVYVCFWIPDTGAILTATSNTPSSTLLAQLITCAVPVKLSVSAGCMASVSVNGCFPAASINLIAKPKTERTKEAIAGCYCSSPVKIRN